MTFCTKRAFQLFILLSLVVQLPISCTRKLNSRGNGRYKPLSVESRQKKRWNRQLQGSGSSKSNPSYRSSPTLHSLGFKPAPPGQALLGTPSRYSLGQIPAGLDLRAVDLRPLGLVPPVRDQGRCGACWAFVSVAAVEGANAAWLGKVIEIYNGSSSSGMNSSSPPTPLPYLRLSRQQVLDCSGVSAETPKSDPAQPRFDPKQLTGSSEQPDSGVPSAPTSQTQRGLATIRSSAQRAPVAFGCEGGSPYQALTYIQRSRGLVRSNVYPYTARDAVCNRRKESRHPRGAISGWEIIPPQDIEALKAAVFNQPIIVSVDASSQAFQEYSGGIFRGPCGLELNHNLLLVGYDEEGDSLFWILQNSWGEGWGEGGYMRLEMKQGEGLCGVTSSPAVYPAITLNASSSFCPPNANPCGARGACANLTTGEAGYTCSCRSDSKLVKAHDGSVACVSVDVCSGANYNPCVSGACLDDGEGSYNCDCPTGFLIGADVLGRQTCVAGGAQGGDRTYITLPGDSCLSVSSRFRLSVSQLLALNPGLECPANNSGRVADTVLLQPGQVLATGESTSMETVKGCSQTYTIQKHDTCDGILSTFNLTKDELFSANSPGLNCKHLKQRSQICVRLGYTNSTSGADQRCGLVYTITANDTFLTCQDAAAEFGLPLSQFLLLNPGINCDAFSLDQQICIATFTSTSTITICQVKVRAQLGDSCWSLWARAGLTPRQFFALNPGVQCNLLQIGQRVCIK